jgi:hypothetical protein
MLPPTISAALAVTHESDLRARAASDKWARLARPDGPKQRRLRRRPALKIRRPVRTITATA